MTGIISEWPLIQVIPSCCPIRYASRMSPRNVRSGIFVLYMVFLIHFQQVALARLGVPLVAVPAVVFSMILGSLLNIPIWARSRGPEVQVLALNAGGALIPGWICWLALKRVWLMAPQSLSLVPLILLIVSLVANRSSVLLAGRGVVMAPLPPAVIAALCSQLLTPPVAPLVAFSTGVLGVLVGADLVRVPRLLANRLPVIAIGGAGSLDGILMTGLLATLLA